jgi:hypothetical protein
MAHRIRAVSTCLVTFLVSSLIASAQPAPAPSGHWEGAIQIPGQELKIEVDLAKTSDKWDGTITIPAQGIKGFPLALISTSGDSVSFAMKGIPGDPSFKGSVAKDAKTMTGEFSQGGGSVPFTLTRTGDAKIEPVPRSTPITKEIEGSWEGPLDIEGKILRLGLKLSNQAGVGTGTMISIDQGGAEIPIAAVVQTGAQLKLLLPAIAGSFEGELKDAQLTGKWTQGPRTWPLVFKRTN